MTTTTSTSANTADFKTSYSSYTSLQDYTQNKQNQYVSNLFNGNTNIFSTSNGSGTSALTAYNSALANLYGTNPARSTSSYLNQALYNNQNKLEVSSELLDKNFSGLQKVWDGDKSHTVKNTNLSDGNEKGSWLDINLDGVFDDNDVSMANELGLDSNDNGKLYEKEVAKAITKQADLDEDGVMTRQEYVNWLTKINQKTITEKATETT